MAFSRKYATLAIYGLLSAVVLLAYVHTLGDPLVRDDYWLLGQVRDVSFTHLWGLFQAQTIYLRPLGMFTWWVEYRLAGAASLPADIFDIALDSVTVCLVFWFLRRLVKPLPAFFAALLLAVTPIGTETITWSAARFDPMVLSLMILALGLYYDFLMKGNRWTYWGSMVAVVAALMTKEPGVIVLGMIPVLELLYGHGSVSLVDAVRQQAFAKRALYRWLPLLLIFIGYMLIRYVVFGGIGGAEPIFGEPVAKVTLYSALAFIFPLYQLNVAGHLLFWMLALAVILGMVAAGVVLVIWMPGRAASRRAIIFLGVFLIAALLPVFHFIFIDGIRQDLVNSRYMFLPAFAFLSIVSIVVFDLRWRVRYLVYPGVALLSCVALLYFVALQKDEHPWEAADAESGLILAETRQMIPDPPPNAVFYYEDMPVMTGYRIFEHLTLQPAVNMKYHRNDIQVYVEGDQVDQNVIRNAYIIEVDSRHNTLKVTPPPEGGAGSNPQ